MLQRWYNPYNAQFSCYWRNCSGWLHDLDTYYNIEVDIIVGQGLQLDICDEVAIVIIGQRNLFIYIDSWQILEHEHSIQSHVFVNNRFYLHWIFHRKRVNDRQLNIMANCNVDLTACLNIKRLIRENIFLCHLNNGII